MKVARSNEGAVEREFLRGAERWVPATTEAFPLTCMPKRTALARVEVGLMAADLKMVGSIVVVVLGICDVCSSLLSG